MSVFLRIGDNYGWLAQPQQLSNVQMEEYSRLPNQDQLYNKKSSQKLSHHMK
jgi:hypothetical protein